MTDPAIAIPLVLIPALCLAACLITAALGPRLLRGQSHWPTVLAIGAAFVLSLAVLAEVHRRADEGQRETIVRLWQWAAVPGAVNDAADRPRDFVIDIALRADPLTAVMLVVVTFVAFLVAVYSIGYMHGDRGYWRFFTYVALFVFSMTMLVSASNFVLLYVFWEAVGLCSYLLIGFWYEKPAAAAAGKKAFLVNRVGDFGFALAVFLIFTTYGTLDFHDTLTADGSRLGVLGAVRLAQPGLFVGGGVATAICLLLMLGACGKSAQIPLHVWLPDAMEGPTPVSALIHAATMVTAGIYMVVRCAPLFAASPDALAVVAGIGGATALMAAIVAVTQTDLKRILAYSTVSQLGYMFLGLGVGTLAGMTAGMFHLVTHAFFKGLLFLGAGSVMHAMGGVIDITRFGGLRRRMPTTHATFLVGSLALAGFPFISGFYSKDAILAAVHDRAHAGPAAGQYALLYYVGLATALLTAFYTFRAYFLTFHGEERVPHEAGHHAHESPATMTGPLVVLALFSAVAGLALHWSGALEHFLAKTPSLAYLGRRGEAAEGGHMLVALVSGTIAMVGIGLAWLFYLGRPAMAAKTAAAMKAVGAWQLSAGKFFFDQMYNMLIVWPLEGLALAAAWFDRKVVDGLVDGVGRAPALFGAMLRPMQFGLAPFYALAMLLGILLLLGTLLL